MTKLTGNRHQDLARDFLRIAREEFERNLRTREYHIRNAANYGLTVSEIATVVGMNSGDVAAILDGE